MHLISEVGEDRPSAQPPRLGLTFVSRSETPLSESKESLLHGRIFVGIDHHARTKVITERQTLLLSSPSQSPVVTVGLCGGGGGGGRSDHDLDDKSMSPDDQLIWSHQSKSTCHKERFCPYQTTKGSDTRQASTQTALSKKRLFTFQSVIDLFLLSTLR